MPVVINRHHYQNDRPQRPFPVPWLYIGRGTPLGNPFTVAKHGQAAIGLYRRWLWEKIQDEDPEVLRELDRITEQTSLVCSCAPRPCHGDIIVRAWRWRQSRVDSRGGLRVVNGGKGAHQ